MKNINFTITVTPPLVDTVDIGQSVFGGLSFKGGPVPHPFTAEDRLRAVKLGRRSDIGVFSFTVDEANLSSTCQDIAVRILSKSSDLPKFSEQILVQGEKESAVISLIGVSMQQLADQIFSTVKETFTIKGAWSYQSFLLLPTDAELADKPGSAVTSRKWASGQLNVLSETDGEFEGELVFAPDIKLNVKGKILPSTNSLPAIFEAIGEGLHSPTTNPTKGAIYKIMGWIPTSFNGENQLNVCGSVLAVRGADPNPEIELGKMPIGTMGTFVLSPA
jgi:hypothetical protein